MKICPKPTKNVFFSAKNVCHVLEGRDSATFDGGGSSKIIGATDRYILTIDMGFGDATVASGAQNVFGILNLVTLYKASSHNLTYR